MLSDLNGVEWTMQDTEAKVLTVGDQGIEMQKAPLERRQLLGITAEDR
jgi:hypothetical protein